LKRKSKQGKILFVILFYVFSGKRKISWQSRDAPR
jgi:hypothetical protein